MVCLLFSATCNYGQIWLPSMTLQPIACPPVTAPSMTLSVYPETAACRVEISLDS